MQKFAEYLGKDLLKNILKNVIKDLLGNILSAGYTNKKNDKVVGKTVTEFPELFGHNKED